MNTRSSPVRLYTPVVPLGNAVEDPGAKYFTDEDGDHFNEDVLRDEATQVALDWSGVHGDDLYVRVESVAPAFDESPLGWVTFAEVKLSVTTVEAHEDGEPPLTVIVVFRSAQ